MSDYLHNIRHIVSEMKRKSTKDPRLARAKVSGYNKPKRTPSHPTKSHVVVAKDGDQVKTPAKKKDSCLVRAGDKIGSFTFIRSECVGKNKTWIVECVCGEEKRFWKYSAIARQKTCGCGVDECGLTKEQRRMLNSRLHSYKSGARKRGLDWDLSYKEFYEVSSGDCVYCGGEAREVNYFKNAPSLQEESPNRDWSLYTIRFNGIDRVNSSMGYSAGNCVSCCIKCNRAKNDMSFEDFRLHIERIYKWLNQ